MSGYQEFFALNQNNATTKTYGTPSGPNTDGSNVYSYHFKPFYYKSTGAGTSEICRFNIGEVHYFKATYTVYRPTLGPGTSPSAFLCEYACTFNDTVTDNFNIDEEAIKHLELYGTPNILGAYSTTGGIVSAVNSGQIAFFAFATTNAVVYKGIYEYV